MMFTNRDKIKELIKFFVTVPGASCLISENKDFLPVGVSVVLKYRYNVNDIEIVYNKWFVESFELAKQMKLDGYEHHNKLVKGSGVLISSKNFGNFIFYGNDAQDIINACESSRTIESCFIKKPGTQR